MTTATFRAVITAVDQASGVIRGINARLAALGNPMAGVRQSLGNIGQELTVLSQASGLTHMRDRAGAAMESMRSLGGQVALVAAPLAALGAAGTLAGLVSLVRGASDAASEMNDLAARTGASVAQLGALRYSAAQTGVPLEAMEGALMRLQRTMNEAATGGDDEAASLFKQLRISLRDARGQMRPVGDVMEQVARSMGGMESAANRNAAALKLFGRSGAGILPALRELEDNTARMRRLDGMAGRPVFTEADRKQLDDFGDSMTDLERTSRQVTNAIGRELAPVFAPVVEGMTEYLATNRELIATNVASAIRQIRDALREIDWEPVRTAGRAIREAAGPAIAAIGGIKTIILVTGGVLASTFVLAVLKAAAAVLLFALSPLRAVFTLGRALVGLVPIFARVGLAAAGMLAANPVLLAVGASIALVAAGVWVIWRNWDAVSARLRGGLAAWLQGWRDAGRILREIWDGIVERIRQAIERIRELMDVFGTIGPAMGDPEGQRLRRERMRDRGGAGGFYPSVPQFRPPAAGGEQQGSRAADPSRVVVEFRDLPANARVRTEHAGSNLAALNVGYAFS